jgi:hypothetical protein
MAQGDASVYPITTISISVMAICYIFAQAIAIIADLLYDFYLVKFSKTDQKEMIQTRVRNDFVRYKNILKPDKIEQFDNKSARNRLTIISKLINERIYSKEHSPFYEAIYAKKQQENKEEQSNIPTSKTIVKSYEVSTSLIETNLEEVKRNSSNNTPTKSVPLTNREKSVIARKNQVNSKIDRPKSSQRPKTPTIRASNEPDKKTQSNQQSKPGNKIVPK